MKWTGWKSIIGAAAACCMLSAGCSSFRSDIHGAYGTQARKQTGMKPVSILFQFTHERQTKGIDVIPKLEKRHQPVDGFGDIFADALQELGNVGSYATFTDRADDVNQPERRALKDSLTASNDYAVHLKFRKETSFAKRHSPNGFSAQHFRPFQQQYCQYPTAERSRFTRLYGTETAH